jgi:hypothetical protein
MGYLKLNINIYKQFKKKNDKIFMLSKILETLSWGVSGAMISTVLCIIVDIDIKSLRNIVVMTTIFSMIRGYTGKNIIDLLCDE